VTSSIIAFNYLNTKKPKLLIYWMKMTNQLPDYEVIGLSKKKYNEFWTKEKEIFGKYMKYYPYFVLYFTLLFTIQLFFVKFETNLLNLLFFNTLHSINMYFFFHVLLHFYYTINGFYLTVIKFLTIKFNFIFRKIKKIEKSYQIQNYKLDSLVFDFFYVLLEADLLNQYWSLFFGLNFIFFFIYGVFFTFVIIVIDIFGKFGLATLIILLYIFIIFFSFRFAHSLSIEV
jgi:hypothetical protein